LEMAESLSCLSASRSKSGPMRWLLSKIISLSFSDQKNLKIIPFHAHLLQSPVREKHRSNWECNLPPSLQYHKGVIPRTSFFSFCLVKHVGSLHVSVSMSSVSDGIIQAKKREVEVSEIFFPIHIWNKNLRDLDRSILLLIIFKN
jgi:hypothetical protein